MQTHYRSIERGDLCKKSIAIILLLLISLVPSHGLHLSATHDFYSLEVSKQVQRSSSMISLNRCKEKCLMMKDYFPFRFRYHRLIYRQTNGFLKYVTGTCEVKMNILGIEYDSWSHLHSYIKATRLGKNDVKNQGQAKVWKTYFDICEDPALKLTVEKRKSLGLVRHHSDFLYYDDQNFKNLRPFTDIGSLLSSLAGKIKY